ncbi:hypothetical protein CQ14_26625 [Bradyrhizobium lablabi]|uniref:Uncharacterized protein n=1 Tax=Bradyrhizobium lablabi TaxID=722472 RepID=A0A0R3N145_9BRAD|nr:hypothetical protein [Bradyrhizobium lablabi]KRR26071.1 hypothetical protein CQ14_26625 [Bradyrhizobium lablabi]
MAESEKNARRSDEAERSRHIAATESVAFATVLLGLLNDADTVLHRLEHEEARTAEPADAPADPAEIIPAALTPADPDPGHNGQHTGATESPAADLSPAIHADAAAMALPQDENATSTAASPGEVLVTDAFASPASPSFSASPDHAPSAGTSSTSTASIALPSIDLGATVHSLADTVTGIVDAALATVSSTIANLGTTVGQLTTSLTGTVSHLLDGLTGTVTGATHDAPATGLLEPLVKDVLGPALGPTDVADTSSHGLSLLDTAGAIPTSFLHPIPLQLGFLGQPTMDGHEPHDGAFSALGIHHF